MPNLRLCRPPKEGAHYFRSLTRYRIIRNHPPIKGEIDIAVKRNINMEINQMKQFALLLSVLFIGAVFVVTPPSYAKMKAGSTEASKSPADSVGAQKASSGAKEDKGIGPIKSVKLGPIDKKLVEEGKSQFEQKCMSCHRLDSRLVGPALEDVTNNRSPEFIMNMMLNSSVMTEKDPVAKKLLDEYHIPMVVPGISKHQARAVLEYLRSVAAKKK